MINLKQQERIDVLKIVETLAELEISECNYHYQTLVAKNILSTQIDLKDMTVGQLLSIIDTTAKYYAG